MTQQELRSVFFRLVVCSAALALGCTDSHGVDDAGTGTDSGTLPGMDSGMGGTDAGPASDGGQPDIDAGDTTDGGGTDAGPANDGGPAPTDGGLGVVCDTDVCTGTEICCVMMGGARACSEPADCMGAMVACDGPEDCASGENCCGSFLGGARAECQAMMCTVRLCHAASDCTGMGEMCCPFMTTGYCSSRGCF